jgi:hypothetical protein
VDLIVHSTRFAWLCCARSRCRIGMLLNLLVGSEIQYARVMHSTHLYKRWDRDLSDEIVQSELNQLRFGTIPLLEKVPIM